MLTELKIKRILFATDFLQSSRLALDHAVAFAHHFKAIIIMLHVVELSNPAMEAELVTMRPCMTRQDALDRLEALASGPRRAGITVETHADNGIPCEVILSAVATYSADILVLGIQGVHRGIEHLLIGSTTEKILLSADCPTLTVGANVMAGIDLELRPKEILYFSDFTPEAAAAAPYALLLGKQFHVPVDVCQLIPEVAEENQKVREMVAEEYCDMMRRLIPEPHSDWCLPEFHLNRGMAIDQIIERAESQVAGLIVLGVRTRSLLWRHLHTSFAYQLLAKATCLVFTIRRTRPSPSASA